MAGNESVLQSVDSYIGQVFAGWNIYTTILAIVLSAYLVYPLFLSQEPDTHPLLLARQSSASPVRQPGESAVYRSQETPYGYPLRAGLNVKDPGSPKWTSGRDGDLKDVWRTALEGNGEKKAYIISVMGKETFKHKLEDLTKHINAIGKHIEKHAGKRVAIYLPNSVEFLVAFFAAAFYGFTPILIPQKQSFEVLAEILHNTNADFLIAPAGTVPIEHLAMSCPNLKHSIWVVEKSSRHLDFKSTPKNTQTAVEWHEIIRQATSESSHDLLSFDKATTIPNVISILKGRETTSYEVVESTQQNIIAAVAAQISALPRTQRFEPSDLVMPLDSLTSIYPLVVTLAAIFSYSSIALNSVAGSDADYDGAFQSVSPTVVIASAQTMVSAHRVLSATTQGNLYKIQLAFRARALAVGRMIHANTLLNPGTPRLIFISATAGPEALSLTLKQLNDLRLLTGARTVYALTASSVAGAITQTSVFDYRAKENPNRPSHFGPPLSSVELKVVDSPDSKISDDSDPSGHVVVSGPAVVGGQVNLGVMGTIREDGTLALD